MASVNRASFYLIHFSFAVLLSACQSVSRAPLDVHTILYDEGFTHSDQIIIESETDIFKLEEEAKAFVKRATSEQQEPLEQIKALVYALFDRADFNILYDGNANTVANDTFTLKAANCLSLSIMTYALAEEAGFKAQFQDIDIPEYWTRNQGFSMLNGHINLRLSPKSAQTEHPFVNKGFLVDFDPLSSRNHFKKRLLSKSTVMAMFYNNKGADALINDRLDEAYAYFRKALLVDESFESTAGNLGFLYRLKGYIKQAEESYRYALDLNPDNLTAWENLSYLYLSSGREEQANRILAKVEEKRASNPYFYINLGEQKLESGEYKEAISYFKDAMALDRKRHEVYFGLAQVYFELGELDLTEHYLQLARDFSVSVNDERRYESKLRFLTEFNENSILH
ncbi:tetratricopeptide repeat protein [Flavobacterium sp. W21_SRS_FM6]|uniref:tetratricopeptide repeat protein n=1 Tax=Flavobacterium sp. W21_SRS_FM6 TaxID=3240268 RepID=UPI003F93708F